MLLPEVSWPLRSGSTGGQRGVLQSTEFAAIVRSPLLATIATCDSVISDFPNPRNLNPILPARQLVSYHTILAVSALSKLEPRETASDSATARTLPRLSRPPPIFQPIAIGSACFYRGLTKLSIPSSADCHCMVIHRSIHGQQCACIGPEQTGVTSQRLQVRQDKRSPL